MKVRILKDSMLLVKSGSVVEVTADQMKLLGDRAEAVKETSVRETAGTKRAKK